MRGIQETVVQEVIFIDTVIGPDIDSVSYTHRFKDLALGVELHGRVLQKGEHVPLTAPLVLKVSSGAVSYTHLDVYKRQWLYHILKKPFIKRCHGRKRLSGFGFEDRG